MNIRERQPGDLEAVRRLLEANALPFKGMELTRGWVAEEDGHIISHIALEEAEGAVVLRSLVTAPAVQGRGIARRLMELAEAQAGDRTILLRTKTIGSWALRLGYSLIASDQVPASVRSTSEFEGSICSGFPIYLKQLATLRPEEVKTKRTSL
jgi:N-acetylglutamate synthase-like GNAT family acetyltransferase